MEAIITYNVSIGTVDGNCCHRLIEQRSDMPVFSCTAICETVSCRCAVMRIIYRTPQLSTTRASLSSDLLLDVTPLFLHSPLTLDVAVRENNEAVVDSATTPTI